VIPVGRIAEKAVCRSVFLPTWHRISSAELTKTHSFRLLLAHWDAPYYYVCTKFLRNFRSIINWQMREIRWVITRNWPFPLFTRCYGL